MSRVVVTGARGFLGRHVCSDLAAAGNTVVPVGRDSDGQLCDLESGRHDFIADADVVVHLAGELAKGPDTSVSHYLGPNVMLTEGLLLQAAAAGVSRFVFSSSRLVYPSDLGRSASEADQVRPEGAYGLSKMFAEHVIAHQAAKTGVRATSLRISQLVGPGDGNRGALARFGEAARSGAPIRVTGEGIAVRDVIDVRDAARAVRLAMAALASDDVPAAINIGSGGTSIRELAEVAAAAAGRPIEDIEFTSVDNEDRSHWALNTRLASTTIGWQAEITLADALRHRWAVDPDLA